jgi:hypothetical protein
MGGGEVKRTEGSETLLLSAVLQALLSLFCYSYSAWSAWYCTPYFHTLLSAQGVAITGQC